MAPPMFRHYEDRAHRAALSLLERREKEISLVLKQALDDIRATMSRVYERYSENGVLTKAQMTRYNRMVNLEAQVQEIIDPALAKTRKVMKRVPPEAYGEAFFRYAWAMDNGNGVRLRWGALNLDAIARNLDNAMDKISLERYGPEARLLVRGALNKGLPVGKSYVDMAKDIKKALDTTAFKALRITRTEGVTALNAGQSDAYARAEEQGVEGSYIWDATLDGRTRPSHGAMDGAVRDEESGQFDGPSGEGARYPGDENLSAEERINCRCRLRFEVEGYAPLLRRTREDGLVPYQTYDQWKAGEEGKGPRVRYTP